MQLLGADVVVSATDINNFLACEHLTKLDLKVLRGELERPDVPPQQAALLAKLGDEHELRYLERLRDEGRSVTTIERRSGREGIERSAADTAAAMERGDDVIYQATFFDGETMGRADFVCRVDRPSPGAKWPWHYEVEDTKLARSTQPYFLLQLAYYSHQVARVTGVMPESMHVILGSGRRESFRVEDFAAYYRGMRDRFLERVHDGAQATYPTPVDHCGLCVWDAKCKKQREDDDHLSLVAGMTKLQTARLNAAGIVKLEELAKAAADPVPEKMKRATFEKLKLQARLQDEQREAIKRGEPDPYKREFLKTGILLPAADPDAKPVKPRGLYLLPVSSTGDVFFDMEGDPYFDIGTGLEYLFGAYTPEDRFHAFWGCDRGPEPAADRLEEKRAFEAFVDFVMERRRRFPDMHVYHYASYEKTALKKLTQRHATREAEVDILLREERLVDLFTVVRQAIVVGQPGYSIKLIEAFYGKRGDAAKVKSGDESILQFEEWLAHRNEPATRDDRILADLEKYNEYDCVSTYGLRQWLLELREEAAKQFAVEIPPFAGKPPEERKFQDKYVELKAKLDARIPEDFDPAIDDPRFADVRPLFLARHMLEYHWREDKPVYWQFYDRCDTYHDEPLALEDDLHCIVGLTHVGTPVPVDLSFEYEFTFPPQLHKLEPGECFDLETRERAGTITEIQEDEAGGRLLLRRAKRSTAPLPRAITTRKLVPPRAVLDALARFAEDVLVNGERSRYRAAFDVLTQAYPRLRGHTSGSTIAPDVVDERSVGSVCRSLDESYLFVQGPPGSGKTYLGARLILDLIDDGKTVGVAANSHKAVHNLLDEVEAVAAERGVSFKGLKKISKQNEAESTYTSAHVSSIDASLAVDGIDLVAGTAWAFGPAEMDQRLDYLFIDEAGQVALPHAIAMMTAAKNTVFLGDPLQLPQVTQTQHPGDIGASVLEHLLGHEMRPVTPDRGILLADSYRMHPDVCRFISELLYEGKLRSAAGRELQDVASPGLSGTGLRYLAVEHSGNAQRSEEEAERIASEIETLLVGTVRDFEGRTRPLTPADIIVVTPYNAQVRCIERVLEARGFGDVEVGTVDKFQGREAYVVFFSTAASSPEDASRGVVFVFDRQRFNVAISRARALAVMVGSPELRARNCTSVEQMMAANGVCRFLEMATVS